jgi:hypothetical protein
MRIIIDEAAWRCNCPDFLLTERKRSILSSVTEEDYEEN